MNVAKSLLPVMFAALLVVPATLYSQVRQVQPRPGQPATDQPQRDGSQTADEPPRLRQVTPRGSDPQAIPRTAALQSPRYAPARRIVQRWRLGIDTTDAPQGVRITTVYRNSAAIEQLGLEPGDYILDVAGYPVGKYQGTYYELADHLNLYADQQGWVNINIWNFRTQREEDYWVQMKRR